MKKLYIIWTNADPVTSHNMVMMYATNSMLNRWWDEVVVVIWGATAKYVVEDEKIQERIEIARSAGVKFSSCLSCANNLGLTEDLKNLGFEVIRWGESLSTLIQNGEHVMTL